MEPIIIIIFIAIIAAIGVLLFARMGSNADATDRANVQSVQDLARITALANMPELRCTSDVTLAGCLDEQKVAALAQLMRENAQARVMYAAIFGETNITVDVLDMSAREGTPSTSAPGAGESAGELAGEVLSGGFTRYTLYAAAGDGSVRPTSTYMSVYDPRTGQRRFAIVTVWRGG
jgi:hypothetical protein